VKPDVSLADGFLLGLIGALVGAITVCWCASYCAGAEPRKPTLTIALDDGPRSMMLKRELQRDWLQPNPAVKLAAKQRAEVARRGAELNKLAAKIDGYFRIVYVGRDDVPLSVTLPAVRVNRGKWEPLDGRAFAFESRPLVTLDWYRARHAAIAKDEPKPERQNYWEFCTAEGYSGAEKVETPAPWEPKEIVRVRGAQIETYEFGL
jgi:hypothetical protein